MPNIYHGFIRAIITTISGLIIALFTRAIIVEAIDNEGLALVVSITIFAFSLYILSGKMNYWGIMYTTGWFIGIAIMFYMLSSMISPIEIISYLGVTVIILGIKISHKFGLK